MEVNGDQQMFGYTNSSKIFFYIAQKKETHTGLEQLEGEKMIKLFSVLGELSV